MGIPEEAFDIVVVGAGASGAVIASRASENPALTVALVEAGPDYGRLEDLPFDLRNSHNNSYTDHDWGFDYQPTVRGSSRPFPRGRVTGGSTAVNTTIALRGMPEDYDGWAVDNPEWAWDKVLPAFNRLERDLDYGDKPYHGDAGPISIRRYTPDELTPVHQAFLEASRVLGYPECQDANDPDSWGAGPHPMNKIGRLRISTAVGYLSAARARENLKIVPNALARRVIIAGGRATGIEVDQDGEIGVVRGKLILLASGALQTPLILMRSGIGPAAQLAHHGIDVLHDIPAVGSHLCDHPALAVACSAKEGALIDFDQPIVQTILRYTAPGSEHRNDLQIEQFSFSPRDGGQKAFAVAAVLEQAYSTGEVRLRSADPKDSPLTEQRFCEDERDLKRLVGAFKETIRFVQTKPLADLVDEQLFPSPARTLDDDAIAELCLKLSASGFHPCGTVKMGLASDAEAVVDQFGRMHAVDGLAVADASIMPSVPRANTNLTCIMIGEMVGEWLRTRPQEYGI